MLDIEYSKAVAGDIPLTVVSNRETVKRVLVLPTCDGSWPDVVAVRGEDHGPHGRRVPEGLQQLARARPEAHGAVVGRRRHLRATGSTGGLCRTFRVL